MEQVDKVIVDLIGDAQVAAEKRAGLNVFGRTFGEEGAGEAGGFEKLSRLQADVSVIVIER